MAWRHFASRTAGWVTGEIHRRRIDMSWGGRGRDEDARERMIDAARRSGMSVGELVQALAEESGSPRDRAPRRRRVEDDDDRWDRSDRRPARASRDRESRGDIDAQLDVLAERLRGLSAGEAPVRSRARERGSDAALEEIAATVERLGRQLPEPPAKRAAKARPQTDVAAVLAALDGLDRKVKAMNEERAAAARPRRDRAGLGDLDHAIAEIARHQTALERDKRPRKASAGTDLERHFRDLSDKIEQLRARDERNSPEALIEEIRSLRQFIEQRSGSAADVGDEIRKLAGRIDEMATQNPERGALEPLMTEMGRLRDVVLQSDVEGSLKSLEAGYGHIVDRLDDLKRGLASPRVGATVDAEISEIHNLLRAVPQVTQFSSIEQSLRDLAGKIERLAGEETDPITTRLERRIGELKTQIDRVDPSSVVKALDQRLKVVTEKLDAIEKASRGPVTPEHVAGLIDDLRTSAAGSGTGEEMRALEARLAELSDRIADLDRRRPSFDDTDRLHDRIAEIAGKLDRMAVPVTDRRTVDALESTISRLDELMSRQSAPVPAGMVDGRVAELIERLDRGEVGPASADIDALGRQIAEMRRELTQSRSTVDLEAEMRKLAERLERSATQEPDDEALSQIEDQLAAISRKLEASESRFGSLSGLEDTIRRLGDRIEAHQADTIAAARDAAREMVRELGGGRADPVSDDVLRGLQDDLRALRSAARDGESRTNDTLISLHDALTGIVGRLTAIEKIAQGSARAATPRPAEPVVPAAPAAAPVAAPIAAPIAARLAPEPAPAAAAPAQPAPGGVASAIARARQSLATSAAEDTRPLEPGSGKPAPRTAMVTPPSPSMAPTEVPVATPAAPIGSGEKTPAAARKADFIAAARRAAQAAAGAAEAPLTATAEDRTAPVAATGTDGSSNSALARIGQVLKNRRRPLVLATGALVLAVLTLRLIPGGGDGRLPETAEAPRNETQSAIEKATPPAPATAARTPTAEAQLPAAAPVPAAKTAEQVPPAAPATAPSTVATDTPAARPPVPAATPQEKPQAAMPTTPGGSVLSDQPAQRTSSLARPTPDASLLGAPETTGSIGAQTPSAAPDTTLLPAKIGSEKLRRAAMSGDPRAAFEVGMRYAEGRGVAADAKAASEWYAKAAEKGLAAAQYRWAVALEKGIGVARDTEQAKRWYAVAAEAGNVRAMHNLGVLHANARDIATALPWFQKAADLGLRDSQFNLGIIHALGSGVKQDLAVSYKWFALAARQGDKEADKKMGDVATHLSKTDLAAARMAVQTWVQKPLDREANEEQQVWAEPKEAPKAATAVDRDTVAKVQSLLKSRGLYGGTVDGQMGAQTKAAIVAFQKKAGLTATGEVDGDLVQALSGKTL